MSGFYRFEFVRGPHDGLTVEGDTMVAPSLRLPTQAETATAQAANAPTALYELSTKNLRWEETGPQAVLRYEFRDTPDIENEPGRIKRWFAERRLRLARWLMAPIDYPMTTRR